MFQTSGRGLLAAGALTACLMGASKEARATLGDGVATVAANELNLRATRSVQSLASGERHDLVLPSGIVVHQYVSPGGVVYALSWRGPRMPDLRELMGAYFAQATQRGAWALAWSGACGSRHPQSRP